MCGIFSKVKHNICVIYSVRLNTIYVCYNQQGNTLNMFGIFSKVKHSMCDIFNKVNTVYV